MSGEQWFNAQLLKALRRKLGWTQLELSKRASLSVRVIAKAEAERGVAMRTLQALVRALNDAGEEITFDDLRCDPRQTVQKFLGNCNKFGKHAIAQSQNLLAPQVQVVMDGDPLTNPLAGKYQGIEEFEALLHKFFDIFVRDGGTLGDLTQMRLVGQEVIAWGHEFIRVPEAPLSLPSFVMLRIDFKKGLIARIDNFYEATGLMSRVASWAKLYPCAQWIHYFDLETVGSRPRPQASDSPGYEEDADGLPPAVVPESRQN